MAVPPLGWAGPASASVEERARWESTPGWTISGYRTKQTVRLSSSTAVARGHRHSSAFASRSQQRSSYALTHDLSHSPAVRGSRHATADAPLYAPPTRWLKDPARSSAVFASKTRSVQTKANAHPRIPAAAPDCWTRQAINAEVWAPLHVATSERAGWLRPRLTPASLERTGDAYTSIASWSLNTPGPGAVTC
ncbi:hypothetical protein KFE25_011366 [Diacronema lutheri]|uniref:Uncharacterized protein n=1 Tax=Diacronema lutheri TaxID=2081491 RepID=A0A8J5X891_DIALT|nr:hypothetical protein KFE25_011366 [Diacronema lutheri]